MNLLMCENGARRRSESEDSDSDHKGHKVLRGTDKG
jgi:hypothetical protein